VNYLIYELAEVEDSVYKLALEVKRTQKRTNALKNIQIPKYKAIVKMISEMLEEKEREDFFRLKVLKKKKLR
jgi:V/A-type H+-transporting ATPase subunit D